MATTKAKLIREDTTLPDLTRAAHIGMLTLKATGCNSWKTLVGSPENHDRVLLTEAQQRLIDQYDYVVQYLQLKPMRTVMECRECGRWCLTSKNPNAAKCVLTPGCGGAYAYASSMPPRIPKAV